MRNKELKVRWRLRDKSYISLKRRVFIATTAKLLRLIFTEAVLYVHMTFASVVAGRLEIDTCSL
ncbi:hypothetical protein L484_023842 [Morus notabilis]|uniref:Uncharacterized protein n=1 Tax=Morus notabilis TaxID=981085 RepID=W9RFS0_9ROSA|nr:hypothetical protein L484_023842 [Morus notabilis]